MFVVDENIEFSAQREKKFDQKKGEIFFFLLSDLSPREVEA